MITLIQQFVNIIGMELLGVGVGICFVPKTFRFGVFILTVANLLFVASMFLSKQLLFIIKKLHLESFFEHNDMEIMQINATVCVILIIFVLYYLRWIKNILYTAILCIVNKRKIKILLNN